MEVNKNGESSYKKEAAKLLGISPASLDIARKNGLVSYIQYVDNGSVYFTEAGLQEYIVRSTRGPKQEIEYRDYTESR